MAIPKAAINVSSLVLGKCLPSIKVNASKFKVQYLYFDNYLKMHFKKSFTVFAHDPDKICKTGDFALIEELPSPISESITHKVLEVVYKCGNVTDPVTGKKVISTKFRDEIELQKKLYGNADSDFSYEKANARGWQENKRDFSNRPTYRRYNEFQKGDENENQPHSVLD